MAINQGGKNPSNRGSGHMPSDYGQRAALAINDLVPGPNRDKALARIFRCTDRMVRYLRNGRYWSIDRLNQASAAIKGFDAYIASPLHARFSALEQELGELREMLGGEHDDA